MATTRTNRVRRSSMPKRPAQSGAAHTDRAVRPSGSLHVSVRRQADSDVVVLVGELDLATAPDLRSTIDELLLTGHNRIVVDLDAVTFVDAAAIDAVITATCAVAITGGALRITENPRLMRLLELTRETHRVDVARAVQTDCVEPPAPKADRNDDDALPSLLRQSARGDEVAFATVYDLTAARAYGLALRMLRHRGHAAEVVREGYLYLWQHSARFRPTDGSAISWILMTIRRCAVRRAGSMPPGVATDDLRVKTSTCPASRAMLELPQHNGRRSRWPTSKGVFTRRSSN